MVPITRHTLLCKCESEIYALMMRARPFSTSILCECHILQFIRTMTNINLLMTLPFNSDVVIFHFYIEFECNKKKNMCLFLRANRYHYPYVLHTFWRHN